MVSTIFPFNVYNEKTLLGVGGVLENLTKSEKRIIGSAGHLLECEDLLRKAKGDPAPEQRDYDQAVLILRAALAIHGFEVAQVIAEKAVREKDGLVN